MEPTPVEILSYYMGSVGMFINYCPPQSWYKTQKKTAPTPKYIFGLNTDLIKVCDLLNKKLIMYHYLLCLQLNFIYKTE